MPLVKTTLQQDLKAIFTALKDFDGSEGKTQEQAIEKLTADLADSIDTYIKTAVVTSVPILVAPPGGGPVTGAITNTIS